MSVTLPTEQTLADIKDLIERQGKVSENAWEEIAPTIRIHHLERLEVIFSPGSVQRQLYIVLNGLLGHYLLKEDKEFYVDFMFRGQFATVINSYLAQEPSELGIKAIKRSTVAAIPRTVIYKLLETDLSLNILGRKYVEWELVKEIKRSNKLYVFSAKERYKFLLENQPEFVNDVPLKYLASYLGIEAQSLSRIRSEISDK